MFYQKFFGNIDKEREVVYNRKKVGVGQLFRL